METKQNSGRFLINTGCTVICLGLFWVFMNSIGDDTGFSQGYVSILSVSIPFILGILLVIIGLKIYQSKDINSEIDQRKLQRRRKITIFLLTIISLSLIYYVFFSKNGWVSFSRETRELENSICLISDCNFRSQ